jgi:F-type H+-transporting ATPase subunit a
VEHHHSFLYEIVNRILIGIFGEPSERYLELMGAQHGEVFWLPDHVIMAALAIVVIFFVLLPVKRALSVEAPGKLQQAFELLYGGMKDLMDDVIGHGQAERFLPFVGALAVFIFTCNIFGQFFFLQPPTQNVNTTFGLSITAFLFYNFIGLRKHGLSYFKQFLGPMLPLAPLMLPIEIISHLARILSLGMRLFGNIFGEHKAASIFFGFFPLLIPWPMMALGIFGSLLQAFIFVMLTMVYIAGAVATEH